MQKKLSITLLTIILIIILTLTLHISLVNASPVIFNMDILPENQGWRVGKTGNATTSVSNGILTIENNGAHTIYFSPADWNNTVNSTKGWILEFRLKLEHPNYSEIISSQFRLIDIDIFDDFGRTITLYDNRITGDNFERTSIQYLMNTTDNFHVYRVIGQGNILRIFVDEKLAIDTRITTFPAQLPSMRINSDYTNSYWDYISYDTNPNITLTSPALTVVDGTLSYYISNLTGVTLDNSILPIPNGTYAGWCVDKGVTMIRNEAHNIMLYSSTQIPIDAIRQYNWSSVNYILNHKQGSMQEIQDAIWYFVPDYSTPSINETNTWSMINSANANPNYVPGKGEIMAMIAYSGHPSLFITRGSGVQNTILEYRIP